MALLPFKGHPENVVQRLADLVADLVGGPPVKKFCIGRCSSSSRARDKHGCKHLFTLYATDKQDHAARVQDELSDRFSQYVNYSSGEAPADESDIYAGMSYVYLAVWLASSRHLKAVQAGRG
jgi:hypothetical protein